MKQHHDKCSQRYMASEEECNVIERQRTLLLHQRELLDQQLAQLDNVSNISLYKLTYLFILVYLIGTDTSHVDCTTVQQKAS